MDDAPATTLSFGDFRLYAGRRQLARRDGTLVPLSPKQFDTLLFMARNPGELLEKDRLLSALWPGLVVEENNLSQAISQLRRILGDDGGLHRYIVTEPKRGYRFVADVRAAAEAEPPPAPVVPGPPAAASAANPAPRVVQRALGAVAVALGLMAVAAFAWAAIRTGAPAPPRQPSIAVLPFADFSADKSDAFLSDGLTEDLVTQLAQVSGLKVISRTSVMQFQGASAAPAEIARALNVAYLLQGSIRRSDERLRVNVQLIEPARGGHLWAKTYDRAMKDVLAVQSELTAEIAGALRAQLLEPEKAELDRRARANPEAYILYKRGMHLINRHPGRTATDRARARQYFERVIAMDPASPLGSAGLAAYYVRLASWREIDPREGYAIAERHARDAFARDERSVEALLLLATIRGQGHWDWQGAEPFARRAHALSPGDADAWESLAHNVLLPAGRLEEALEAKRQSIARDPLNMSTAMGQAFLLMFMRRCDEAIAQARAAAEIAPDPFQHLVPARCHEMNGRFREAVAAYRLVNRPWLPPDVLDKLDAIGAQDGPGVAEAYWRTRLDFSVKRAGADVDQNYFTAVIAAQLGERDVAFRHLNLAIDARSRYVLDTKVDPMLEPLRTDPRFTAALKRLNLA